MKQVVIRLGGKQYLAAAGDTLEVAKLTQAEGEEFKLPEVLAVIDGAKTEVGTPVVKTEVTAKVVANKRTKKIMVIKFKSKKRYHRTMGHRQDVTVIQITNIA